MADSEPPRPPDPVGGQARPTACHTHPRRPAAVACTVCGAGTCRDCLVHTSVGFKCRACTGGATATQMGREPLRTSRRPSGKAVFLVVAVAVVAVGLFALLRGSPDLRTPGDLGSREDAAAAEPAGLDVTFDGAAGVALAGTLDLPEGAGPNPGPGGVEGQTPHPGVVILPGFGPTTRDGIAPGGTLTDPLYRDLGAVLADAGFAVLRYDKRGQGDSVPLPDEPLAWEHLVEDAQAAVAYLRDRPETGDAVAVVGHDEGGLVGLRLAAEAPPAALVLVSTPGRPLVDVVAGELRGGGFMGDGEALADELEDAVATLLATGEVPEVSEPLQPVLPADEGRYLQALFALDPAALAAGVEADTLVVHGERDPGVQLVDVQALETALERTAHVDVLSAPQAGHTLEVVPEGGHAHGGASGEVERDRATLVRVATWLAERLRP